MKNRTKSALHTKLGERPKSQNDRRQRRTCWRVAGVLLCLFGLNAAIGSMRADTETVTNSNTITTPDSGQAGLYPSSIGTFVGFTGKITAVRVTLHNITHTFPGDYDIMLRGPGGQEVVLMSDCGAGLDLNNVTLTFSDFAPPLPENAQITSGTYRPTNYSSNATPRDPKDTFPPDSPRTYPSSLSVFNGTSLNGVWSLYVVDDTTGDSGSIAGGWTIAFDYTGFINSSPITIPGTGTSGVADPYPAIISVAGLPGNLRRAHVTLYGLSHTFPDDLDVLLVGPNGQNAIVMSDVGAGTDISSITLTLDDAAASSLPDDGPLVSGTFKPTNIGGGDTFPAPAPAPAGTSALSVFNNTNPNGSWNLYIVDDASSDIGNLDGWAVDFDLDPPVLANISTRLPVQTGENVLIGGFIVTGTQPKDVIVRGLGPSLGLPGQLPDPTLELLDGMGNRIWFNDDWNDGTQGFPSQASEIIATGIPPNNTLESAIVATLPANNASYTTIVRGYNGATGIGLVEVYDLNRTANSKLANISTRGFVQTGENVLIAGTIALGWPAQRVIVRAIGPSLPVAGALSDTTLEVRDGSGTLIAFNDDWKSDQESEIIDTGIPPPNILESAIVLTLPANGAAYTAVVRGYNNSSGIGLVEIYALN